MFKKVWKKFNYNDSSYIHNIKKFYWIFKEIFTGEKNVLHAPFSFFNCRNFDPWKYYTSFSPSNPYSIALPKISMAYKHNQNKIITK